MTELIASRANNTNDIRNRYFMILPPFAIENIAAARGNAADI